MAGGVGKSRSGALDLRCWERGDYGSSEWAHPEIEYVIADGPSPGSWKGVSGMAEGWGDALAAWERFHAEVVEFRELDSERVLVHSHQHGRGKTSGLDLGQLRTEGTTLFHIRAGRVTRLVIYFDRDRALADLGLDR